MRNNFRNEDKITLKNEHSLVGMTENELFEVCDDKNAFTGKAHRIY